MAEICHTYSFTAVRLLCRRKGYHELNSGTLRVFLDPKHGKTVLIPYSSIAGIGSFLEDRVAHVDANSMRLESGAVVDFDWLVLAPGSTYADGPIKNFSGSVDDRQAVIQAGFERFIYLRPVIIPARQAYLLRDRGHRTVTHFVIGQAFDFSTLTGSQTPDIFVTATDQKSTNLLTILHLATLSG